MALSSITRGKGKAVAEEIYDTLTLLLRDTFEDRSLVARPEMTADDVDVWDSIGQIRLILAVERAFGVKFATSEIARLATVGELADAVARKRAAR